jgi:two-component system nitrogen regulation response regulator NtrX
MPFQILIIEKENSLRHNLAQHLRQEGFHVAETDCIEDALELLNRNQVRLVLLGLEELKRDGIGIMREVRHRFPEIKIITMNSGDQLEMSIEAMRLGAYDDFLIPFDLDTLITQIQNAIED